MSYYASLGINDFSDGETIVTAYRSLAMKWHPDRNTSPEAESKFVEIQTAYEILKNIEQRAYYDAWLREQYAGTASQDVSEQGSFYTSKMAKEARKYAYKYVDMSFQEFSSRIKVKAKSAVITALKWIGIGFSLIAMAVGGMVGKQVGKSVSGGNDQGDIDNELVALVQGMNRDLPKMLDAETLLDIVEMSSKTMISKHTFVNYTYDEIDTIELEKVVKKNMKNKRVYAGSCRCFSVTNGQMYLYT